MIQAVERFFLEARNIRVMVFFVVAGVGLYVAALIWAGWDQVLLALGQLGLVMMLVAMLVSSSAYLWRFARWEWSLRCFGYDVPRFRHFMIYLCGLALTTTPGKAGETFRSALLLREGVCVSHSLGAFLVDRGSDVLGMLLLGATAAFVADATHWSWAAGYVALLITTVYMARMLLKPLDDGGRFRVFGFLKWMPVQMAKAPLQSWARLWRFPRVVVFSLVAMLAYGTQALVFAKLCVVLGIDVSTSVAVLIFVKATLFGAASMLPGGLGAMEAALVVQLMDIGATQSLAVAAAILIRVVTLWFGVLIGLASLIRVAFVINGRRGYGRVSS